MKRKVKGAALSESFSVAGDFKKHLVTAALYDSLRQSLKDLEISLLPLLAYRKSCKASKLPILPPQEHLFGESAETVLRRLVGFT